ncbi:fumarylacetoacetate hydrolase family protein [Pedobacter puniceum]|uniref:2-hydroxyhepta-2,4-diene-1,7-dioate isomerase n=1 Tax=Pedobacter puniceum TaxID=2666136 RepID=A0A7K0FLR4_9SPHI|nr:fumarylacetoacetate hydrolase family protein [Pedobacter puniceum]MRX46916.1 2-hydroxyhepta-2,4-diene-1,7-dioate isomerase [Pedobacter puniceum]
MKIYKITDGIVIEDEKNNYYLTKEENFDQFINQENLYNFLENKIVGLTPLIDTNFQSQIQAPLVSQEVWAAGVTYLRSRDARMEESQEAAGATFYDKVYDAERPEIFFKATAQRVVGTNQKVRIRKDSTWNVPEPELTLLITSTGKIVGYTIGNDMSSRSIEGENPLYLPQAKVYEKCAALGPCIYVPRSPISPETKISIMIDRDGNTLYQDSVQISQMKRKHTELVEFLFRECDFPDGCFLMTGTCLVPPNEFTLESGDEISIYIENIGTLKNSVE